MALTLSDADDTPGQSKLFLSHFCMEQLSQLQSLTLIDIEFDSLNVIFSSLHHLERLEAFGYDSKTIKAYCPIWAYNYSDSINQFHSNSSKGIIEVASQLKRLRLSNYKIVPKMLLPCLRHLKVGTTTIDQFRMVLSQTPNLHSFNISIKDDASHSEYYLLSSHLALKRLTLQIYSK
ncbi:unnamed protein product [Rotaria sp. Silwood2]|nr:unnamed protein product [Rotaria sp. Silwood2]CAF3377139.1 unnamed protein product [Rotaria sp. Silwood2]CAF4112716.1 unnamed protein product [Rotaria sp. Silwood2]CAF4350520.1 unnamed protein product [Rotaria sp. Silwood2]CAF4595848.1 unnamed protein product [Rotaria sp. Silwood2]